MKRFTGYCLSYIFLWIAEVFIWFDNTIFDNDSNWNYRLCNWFICKSSNLQDWGGIGPFPVCKISEVEESPGAFIDSMEEGMFESVAEYEENQKKELDNQ